MTSRFPAPLYRATGLRALEAAAGDQPLMQRAGQAAAGLAVTLMRDAQQPVLVLAGPGNNGGDGYEMAMHLLQRGHDVRLVITGDRRQPPDAIAARDRFLAAGGRELKEIPEARWALIVDALFGIGLQRPLAGVFAELARAANRLARRDGCPLLALDCPSGLDADTGRALGDAVVRATHTLTFIAGKPGLLMADGPDHAGSVSLATLDLDAEALVPADGHCIGTASFAGCLRRRARNSHKGTNGNAGILGGAPGMLGAAFLAGRAALQLGAGRTYVGCLDAQAPAFDPQQPELMLRRARDLLALPLDALACGPGLGNEATARALLAEACALKAPLLLDADALNLLAADGDLDIAVAQRAAPTLLTPHPAEAARLLDASVAEVQADRIAAALELADRFNAHVALKGCGTVVVTPDGNWAINATGNPGMGSAGMGDVLSGIVVALLAQGWPAAEALAAGVHLHGAAADALAGQFGEIGLTAGETIPQARRQLNDWIATHD
jgi:ADP-dependent NAD(P)H-hydrate dehydratase / NAD(P)H-hydrate epimerase